MSEIEYTSLGSHDIIRPGDEFLLGSEWRNHSERCYGHRVGHNTSRRPIRTTSPAVYEEVPGSRTTQDAVSQPQRERIAYEDLQPGDKIQPGDEWKNGDGRWQPYVCLTGLLQFVQDGHAARRPHRVNTIIIDALADAHAATAQLQNERNEARAAIAQVKAEFNSQADVLAEVRADEKRLVDNLELLRSEYLKLQSERDGLRAEMDTVKGDRMNLREALAAEQRAHKVTMTSGLQACKERDEALAEVAKLSAELWARKPLEDRVASLTEELAQAREGNQQLLKTIAENADMFGDHTKALVQERDEARAERDKLKGLIDDLLDEPTAKQVQDMLRTWATELDWSGCCFDSTGRDKVSAVQRVLVAVIERVETMIHPEGGTDDN